MCIYIYIYIYRERERDVHIYVYMYMHSACNALFSLDGAMLMSLSHFSALVFSKEMSSVQVISRFGFDK